MTKFTLCRGRYAYDCVGEKTVRLFVLSSPPARQLLASVSPGGDNYVRASRYGYLIQRSCEGARLLDHWYAMRRWARIGNNAAYMLAILHARQLGLPLNASDDERHRMPCVHVRPSDNFVKCPMSLSARAPKAGPACPLRELSHTRLTGKGLLAHFPGDKACVQPLLRILRTDGVRSGAEAFGLHTRRSCEKGTETLCCAYGTACAYQRPRIEAAKRTSRRMTRTYRLCCS